MRILIAGIGNIFQGDDAFGCEVVRQLKVRGVPGSVSVADFGIRSLDLAFALTDSFDAIILVDAVGRGSTPGTLYLIEPKIEDSQSPANRTLNAHTMDPVAVIQMAGSLGEICSNLFLVGCEPEACASQGGQMEISAVVREVIPEAMAMIDSLVADLLGPKKPEPKIAEPVSA